MGCFRAKVAAGGLGEGVWAWDEGRGVARVAACRLTEASDVVEVKSISKDRSAVTEAEDGLGWMDWFDPGAGYGEEEPTVRGGLRGCQCPWDTC